MTHQQTHLKSDGLPLSITIQPQHEPLGLHGELLQLLAQVLFGLHEQQERRNKVRRKELVAMLQLLTRVLLGLHEHEQQKTRQSSEPTFLANVNQASCL